ncbi:MAG: PEP-CTERM sorting domain-containing protein [Acidobacteria bacterium]|nr:PEP-CTERM sorting domain-containing protein [Acidobacteriota bacterium]
MASYVRKASALVFLLGATLSVQSASAAIVTLYQSGFEGTDGGWTESGFGEWERGVVSAVFPETGCDNSPQPGPTGAFAGSEAWGTTLSGCYANSGASSSLSQTFDLSSAIGATFEWHDWTHVFTNFDMGELYANGDLLYSVAPSTAIDWTQRSVDLTAYAGAPVTLEFRLFATTVVNRPGWYLDEMTLTADVPAAVPEPTSLLLMTGGLVAVALLRRKANRS